MIGAFAVGMIGALLTIALGVAIGLGLLWGMATLLFWALDDRTTLLAIIREQRAFLRAMVLRIK